MVAVELSRQRFVLNVANRGIAPRVNNLEEEWKQRRAAQKVSLVQ